jgi:glycosyltransferase involved in cell wall biosynthesis
VQVVVVANGCHDDTASRAREFSPSIVVVETSVPSKPNALNLGDEKCNGFPRAYLDADIELSPGTLRILANQLRESGALVAAPAMSMRFDRSAWAVRAYYRVWQQLPYVQEGLIGVGMYMISEEGRRRFDRFPDIIADDGYVRRLYAPHERISVSECHAIVSAPTSLWGLIKIKTRSRLGGYELGEAFPDLLANEPKGYGEAMRGILRQPSLWPAVIAYLGVNAIARVRARRMLKQSKRKVWERDDSSRQNR